MCLLTLAPAGVAHTYDDLEEACYSNPDGFGYAIHTGRHIIRRRSMDYRSLLERYLEERANYMEGPALFHARIATSGKVDNSGCHPFYVGNKKTVLGHNGVLPIKGDTGWRSDTRHLAEVVIPQHGGIAALADDTYRKALGEWMGYPNKLVILSADNRLPDFLIVNEGQGHWKDGVWWSNHSYKRYAPVTTTKYVPTNTLRKVTSPEGNDIYALGECYWCSEALTERALLEATCDWCYADLDAHVDSVWCSCQNCLRKADEELRTYLDRKGEIVEWSD